jgi:peptide/nickel transport system permease protein
MIPLDPIASISKGKAMSEETKQALMKEYNLDKSLPGQYITWIKGLFTGDLGKSFQHKEDVTMLLSVRYKTTLQLVLMSSILIIVLAIPLGVISAARKNSLMDQTLTVTSLVLVSSPPFFTGILLMLLFTMVWPIFPTFGTGSNFWSNLKYLFLPSVSLAAVRVALSMRITRSNMVEQLQAPYVQTATAKGLSREAVVYKHALKNALIPILTVMSLDISGMLGGSVLVEKVFSLNGVGSLLADSISKSDYPVTQSLTLIMVLIFMLCNLIVDIMYGIIDPRVRLN